VTDIAESPHLGLWLFKPTGEVDHEISLDDDTDTDESNVKTFNPNRNKPHVRGMARCVRCKARWEAIVLFGRRMYYHECPACTNMTGMLFAGYQPNSKQETFVCPCDGDLWFILQCGIVMCANCGDTRPCPD
jgi:hypothetical protein